MKKSLLIAAMVSLPILAGVGIVSANALKQFGEQVENAKGYICPINGEELPCECCCPLNNGK